MKNKLLTKEDFNIIIVEWSKGAKAPYNQAAGNTRIVGAQMAELITFLINNTNSKPESFYFVGFDLGAHAAGFAGKRVGKTGAAPGRITGMILIDTVEAPVSGHPRETEKVSATGTGHLRECVNTEFV